MIILLMCFTSNKMKIVSSWNNQRLLDYLTQNKARTYFDYGQNMVTIIVCVFGRKKRDERRIKFYSYSFLNFYERLLDTGLSLFECYWL